jgi:hypothetical protein
MASKPIAPKEIVSKSSLNFQDIELRLSLREKRKIDELTKISFSCRVIP